MAIPNFRIFKVYKDMLVFQMLQGQEIFPEHLKAITCGTRAVPEPRTELKVISFGSILSQDSDGEMAQMDPVPALMEAGLEPHVEPQKLELEREIIINGAPTT